MGVTIQTDALPRFVPCPYCGEMQTHKGTCELGIMRSGQVWCVMAILGELGDHAEARVSTEGRAR